jgi:sensor histidine kinase YesM
MILKPTDAKTHIKKNSTFFLLTIIYTAILIFMSFIAVYFAYQQKKEELLSQMDMTFIRLEQEYMDSVRNFWQIYMPLYEKSSNYQPILADYFISDLDKELIPLKRQEFATVLSHMMVRDENVQWIALFSEERKFNYIFFRDSKNSGIISDDFPYLDRIASKSSRMEVYGMEKIYDGNTAMNTYAICGGAAPNIFNGSIIAGYSTSEFDYIYKNAGSILNSLNYSIISNDNEILFDSSGEYDEKYIHYLPRDTMTGTIRMPDNKRLYVNSEILDNNQSILIYSCLWRDLTRYAHGYTLYILLAVLLFLLISMALYSLIIQFVTKEVNTIRHGLKKIGDNNLDYRIPTNFKQGGLSEVAQSINHMTLRLQFNINRAFHYEIKQKESELSELQAKFNPHFLYNTLEMLRARCSKSGGADTANLITQLAAIFRGFIGSKTFIPIEEELAFCKRYLVLFDARYDDQVQVRYDIDTEVLKYGIIRNSFQPLIENYFVHGFDTSIDNNYILFRGKSLDDKTMVLSLDDNGNGMSDDEIKQLNARLQEPIQLDTESYGLKNLHQRIHLFYGDECGLTVAKNEDKGLSVQMTILKLTCEEYEQIKSSL